MAKAVATYKSQSDFAINIPRLNSKRVVDSKEKKLIFVRLGAYADYGNYEKARPPVREPHKHGVIRPCR